MDTERVKELKTFTNDFNLKLKNAFDQFNNNDKKAIEDAKRSLTESQNSLTPKKKKKTFVYISFNYKNTAFNEKLPWKPNHVYNRYFEKFKKITPLHDLNSWEILRVNNLSKRSFEKEKDLPFKKDMYPCHGVAREFDELNKENKNILRLSKYGDSLLTKFITQNTKRENSLRQKEKDLWEYLHSKPPLNLNQWKPSNHIKTEFSIPPQDYAHSFRVTKKKPFLQGPLRIPKKDGDYSTPSKDIF